MCLKLKIIKVLLNCIKRHKSFQNVYCLTIITVMFQYILHKCLFQSYLKSKKCINDIYTVIFDFKKRIYKVFFFFLFH